MDSLLTYVFWQFYDQFALRHLIRLHFLLTTFPSPLPFSLQICSWFMSYGLRVLFSISFPFGFHFNHLVLGRGMDKGATKISFLIFSFSCHVKIVKKWCLIRLCSCCSCRLIFGLVGNTMDGHWSSYLETCSYQTGETAVFSDMTNFFDWLPMNRHFHGAKKYRSLNLSPRVH